MTTEQRKVYDKIMDVVLNDKGGLFFLNAFGGAGKTFIWRTLSAGLRSKGEIVLTVASSGVAALLIPGGRTAHSRFVIPIIVHEDSTCNIAAGSDLAEHICRAKLIIWDEAPMMHKHSFEAVDRTLKDILRSQRRGNHLKPFGKVTVLGGDFRKILPVIPKGTRQEIVNSTINSSFLWSQCYVMTLTANMRLLATASQSTLNEQRIFSDWILSIGDGKVGVIDDEVGQVTIPNDLLLQTSSNPIEEIVKSTYPHFPNDTNYATSFKDRVILAPRNDITCNEYL